jgi:hypothetical protein
MHGKRNNQQIKETAYRMGNIFAKYPSDNGFISKVYKEVKISIGKKSSLK